MPKNLNIMATSEKKCPALSYKISCHECLQVNSEWHLDRLLKDLAKVKAEQDFEDGKIRDKLEARELSVHQICWLCLLLFGFSVEEIEAKLKRRKLRADLSRTLFKYSERITGKKINNWAQFKLYMERCGYRKGRSMEEEVLEINLSLKIPKNSSTYDSMLVKVNLALD
ncbi:MAG: hypothetical protein F6J89_08495 [Symploca sp. SIO1C4]|uniref:Uncharacterized protein n=1 Tax=Symploca sp. SIO1C4 TaxID=2607765 RepID=A0A6B3N7S9_9CYAN|nr:hypothetical protein [Symploca sp. SIO1C4]